MVKENAGRHSLHIVYVPLGTVIPIPTHGKHVKKYRSNNEKNCLNKSRRKHDAIWIERQTDGSRKSSLLGSRICKKQGISLNQYVNNAILAANTAKAFADEDPNASAAADPTHFAVCREKRQMK